MQLSLNLSLSPKKYTLISVLSGQKKSFYFTLYSLLKNVSVGQLFPVKKNIHFTQLSNQKDIPFAHSLHTYS